MRAMIFVLILAGCSQAEPETVETLLWPVRVPGLLTEDLRLALRHNEIATEFRGAPTQTLQDLQKGGGPIIDPALDIAQVPEAERAALLRKLSSNASRYEENTDALSWDLVRAGRNQDLLWPAP